MGVAIRDIVVPYKAPASWESLQGVATVDAHNALYQFLTIIRQPDGTPLMDSRGCVTSHLSGILFRNLNFIEKGIKPVFVFDGAPPEIKTGTVALRREIRRLAGDRWEEAVSCGDTSEAYRQARSSSRIDDFVIRTSQELLTLLGIPWVQAPSEGEAQAAWMAQRGDAQYAVSQDYDALLFGAPVLVRNLTVSRRRRVRGRTVAIEPERIVLRDVLEGLGISREGLIDLGIMVGTDFNSGIHGIGPKTALKYVQKGETERVLEERLPDFDPGPVREFFLNPPINSDYELKWSPPDEEGVRAMLVDQFEFSPERVNAGLEKLRTSTGQKTLDRWF